jgi:uncharacterized membrane protein
MERAFTTASIAALIFIFMALIMWKEESSVAMIAASISLYAAAFNIYKNANKVISSLESGNRESFEQ